MDLKKAVFAVDVDSIRNASIWSAVVTLGKVNGPPITLFHLQFDCRKHLMRITKSVSYDDDGDVVDSSTSEKAEYSSPPPDSVAERYMDIVCNAADPGISMDGLTPFDIRP